MKKGISVITLMLLFSAALFAYQLSPLSATYDPSGAGSARVYTITVGQDLQGFIPLRMILTAR